MERARKPTAPDPRVRARRARATMGGRLPPGAVRKPIPPLVGVGALGRRAKREFLERRAAPGAWASILAGRSALGLALLDGSLAGAAGLATTLRRGQAGPAGAAKAGNPVLGRRERMAPVAAGAVVTATKRREPAGGVLSSFVTL